MWLVLFWMILLSKEIEAKRLNFWLGFMTIGFKARKNSLLPKPEVTVKLIQNALDVGMTADYVLMDSWFTQEQLIKSILGLRLDVISIVKQLKQCYCYQGKCYTLPDLQKFVRYNEAIDVLGSLLVSIKSGIPAKIVFVHNHNKKSECLYLSSINITLSDAEIVRINRNRWSIKCFLKPLNLFWS